MKADFKDLLAAKMAKDEAKNKTMDILVPSMGKEMTFRVPSDELLLEMADETDTDVTSELVKGFTKLIYMSCDMLHNQELQEKLDIKDPYDTVLAIFHINDVLEIGAKLMDSAAPTKDKIKN